MKLSRMCYMLFWLTFSRALQVTTGNLLTLFTDESVECQKIESDLKQMGLVINISTCKDKEECTPSPTLIYTRDGIEIARANDLSILDSLIPEVEFKDLHGPWFVFIYQIADETIDLLLKRLALEFPILNVGKIHAQKVPENYYIRSMPALVAFYNDISKIYEYNINIESLRNFISTLLAPFSALKLRDFQMMKDHLFFVVFYRNEDLANLHFNTLSHRYKFRARFYKSSDPSLLQIANVEFDKIQNPENTLILAVYKKRRFHKLVIHNFNEKLVNEWIFDSHYEHLTRINTGNFYAIFNAIKPVVLLLTRQEEHCEELERCSDMMHKMRPFTSYLFATLDVDELTGFVSTLLPGIKLPAILIYDPLKHLYYVDDGKIRNVNDYCEKLIKSYEGGKLKTWPRQRKSYLIPILLIFFTIPIVLLIIKRSTEKIKVQ